DEDGERASSHGRRNRGPHSRRGGRVRRARRSPAGHRVKLFSRLLHRKKLLSYGTLAVRVAGGVLAGFILTTLTVDLGPAAAQYGERPGTSTWKRPIHIGRLSIRLFTGHIVVEDFSIEGLTPEDRPFFTAKNLDVTLDWSTVLRREITISAVEMTDW